VLPLELRPPAWREGMVVLGAIFFGSFLVATVVSRLWN
jgi:hypothetical protein